MKVPKDALSRNKKRKNELHCDYLKKPDRSANRRRTDPLIVLSTIFESILNEMRGMPDVHPFIYPVNVKVKQLLFLLVINKCIGLVHLKIVFHRRYLITTILCRDQWIYNLLEMDFI